MFLELIATFAAGFGAAGVVLLINMMTKGRLPKWVMPVAAGLTMIGVGVSNEYTWGARTEAGMPDGIVVVEEVTERQWYRPWSYAVPLVTRMAALDTASVQTNPDAPEVRLADLYLFARWQPAVKIPQLMHCADKARADVTDATLADPSTAAWQSAPDAMIAQACTEDTADG